MPTETDQGPGHTAAFTLARLGDSERSDRIVRGLRERIDADPRTAPRVWQQLAICYARMNELQEALNCFLESIEQCFAICLHFVAQAKSLGNRSARIDIFIHTTVPTTCDSALAIA